MTSPDVTDRPTSGRDALIRFAPAVADTMARLAGASGNDDVRWARAAVSGVTGLPALSGAEQPDGSDRAQAVEELAQQIALDVSSFTAGQRDLGATAFGRSAHTWYLAVYLADWIPRVRLALDLTFGPSQWDTAENSMDGGAIEAGGGPWRDFVAMTEGIGALRCLDAVTTEIVRLRMARAHDCALCRSLRNRTALEAGGTEALYRAIDHWQEDPHFDDRARAILAFTDAMVWTPGQIREPLDLLRARIADAELVELVLDMLRNAANKVAIASGTDAAHVEQGQEIYDVTETGETIFGLGHLP